MSIEVANAKKTQMDKKSILPLEIENEMRTNWGVNILSIAISDIVLSDDDKVIRRQHLDAKKAAEAAKHEAERIKTLADAENYRLQQLGIGFADQLQKLQKTGLLTPDTSAVHVQMLELHKNLPETKANVFLNTGGSGNLAALAAQAGTGLSAGQNSTRQNDRGGDDNADRSE